MIGLFLSTIIGPAYTVAHFYINQTEIAEELCENKEKPELNCNGHCYLKKELTKQNEVNTDQENSEIRLMVIWPYAFNDIEPIEISSPIEVQLNKSRYSNHYHFINEMDLLDPPQI